MAPETKVLIYIPRVKHRLAVSEDSVKKAQIFAASSQGCV